MGQQSATVQYYGGHKFLQVLIYIILLCIVLLGGYLTLSLGNETAWATFSACVLFSALGAAITQKKYAYFVIILLLLYAISSLFVNNYAFFGPIICLVFFGLSYFVKAYKILKYPILLLMATITAFWIIPRNQFYQLKIESKSDYSIIDTLKIVDANEDTIRIREVAKNTHILLIETWHEHCGSCYSAMRDLHPELVEIERKYSFKHMYLYSSSSDLEMEDIRKIRHLPFPNLPIFKDLDSQFRKALGLLAAPVFLLINTKTGVVEQYHGYLKPSKSPFLKKIYDTAKDYPLPN
jgi:thiol-disulfide isomerase/thioredoxin